MTNGPRPVSFAATGPALPAGGLAPGRADYAASPAKREANGDTTGCGDNFVGGVVAGVAEQIDAGSSAIDASRPVDLDRRGPRDRERRVLHDAPGRHLHRVGPGEKLRHIEEVGGSTARFGGSP